MNTVIYLKDFNGKALKQPIELTVTQEDNLVGVKNEELAMEGYGDSLNEAVQEAISNFEELAEMLTKRNCNVENAGRFAYEYEKYVNLTDYSVTRG